MFISVICLLLEHNEKSTKKHHKPFDCISTNWYYWNHEEDRRTTLSTISESKKLFAYGDISFV